MAKTSLLVDNTALYEAALEGLELQKQRIEEQIRQVRAVLGNRRISNRPEPVVVSESKVASAPRKTRKRNLSSEARERIAAAQKKRWDAFRASKES